MFVMTMVGGGEAVAVVGKDGIEVDVSKPLEQV